MMKTRSWLQGVATVPAAALSLLPSFTCPVCLSAYAGALSAAGLTFVLTETFLAPLIVIFLLIGIGSVAWTTRRHRRPGPLLLTLSGGAAVVMGRLVWDIGPVLHIGVGLLVAASAWNLWLKRRRRPKAGSTRTRSSRRTGHITGKVAFVLRCSSLSMAAAATVISCSRSEASVSKEPAANVPAAALTSQPRARPEEQASNTATALHIEGMTCGGCAWQVEDALTKLHGVQTAKVNLKEKCAAVRYDEGQLVAPRLVSAVEKLGYEASDKGSGGVVALSDGTLGCVSTR